MTVTITPVAGIPDAIQTIFDLVRDHGASLSPAAFAAVSAYYPSPVDRVVNTAEALYADMQAAPAGALQDALSTGCAQLADFCVTNSWHALGQTDRGLKMSGAARRLLGIGAQLAADDPAIGAAFVPPVD